MNKLILFFAVLGFGVSIPVASASDASCTDSATESRVLESLELGTHVPGHLKGATITVKLADGKETTVPAERFKVVPRKQQFIVTKLETSKLRSCTTNDPLKNRVSLLGGYGSQSGLTSTTSGTTVEVESNVGFVGGAQYQRMLGKRVSIGVQGQTNKTGSLLLGLDF